MSENPSLPEIVSPPPPVPPAPTVVVVKKSSGPGCFIQALWFIFVGWWLGAIAISVAWFLNVIIIGLPLGMMILNNIPKILALQNPETTITAVTKDGVTTVTESSKKQINFIIRVIYFLFIGWWLSGLWLVLGYLLSLTILLLPIGLAVFRLAPTVTTLRRY